MKVLIQAKDGMLSDIMAIAVEGVLSAVCLQAERPEEALGLLAESADVDLLVAESNTSDSEVLSLARRRKIPLIRVTEAEGELKPSLSEREFVLLKPLNVKEFLDLVRFAVKGDPAVSKDDAYSKVRLDSLLMIGNQFAFDIFVRLSPAKYVRVVRKGDLFDSEKYAHYSGKGIKHLFVLRDDFIHYLDALATSLHRLTSSGSLSLDDSAAAAIQAYESFRDGMESLGITPETQRVMQLTVKLAVRSIEKDPKLKELFSTFSERRESFQAWHSVALCYISCKLCTLMTWNSQNTHYKLALASMLHDIALPKPEWAEFESEQEAKAAGLAGEEMADFLEHPLRAGEMVKRLDDFPGDVDYIIAQHHELPDGAGFPLGQNHTKISPLSSLFIVAHDLAHHLYREGGQFDFLRFLQEFDRRYPLGYFRKIRASLEKLVADELREIS
jgi:hypothetical protein